MNKRFRFLFFFSCLIGTHVSGDDSLWNLYESKLKQAKYVDLTHTITPSIPVWSGFGQSKFSPAINPETKQPYAFAKDGFEATRYELATDQLGTQLDPPGHWAPEYPAIDEIPATFAVRPLVVISIVEQLTKDDNYHLQVADIETGKRSTGVFQKAPWCLSDLIGRSAGRIPL